MEVADLAGRTPRTVRNGTAKVKKEEVNRSRDASDRAMPKELVVALDGPGMTPLLRAGVGGLASAIRSLARERSGARWPSPVALADGEAVVESHRVVLRFGPNGPTPVLSELFSRVFRISREGVISPLGVFDGAPPLGLAIALQAGWKRTFLQHGKATTKGGGARVVQTEVDDQQLRYSLQPFTSYAHQSGSGAIVGALSSGQVKLAGWAYPGAAQRHAGFGETKCEYTAAQAVAAMFSLVGCLSLPMARGGGGVLVIPIPSDLVIFAKLRPGLTPRKVSDVYVAGVGDAVLGMSMALKMSDVVDSPQGVRDAVGLLLQTLPWAKQQKSRSWTLDAGVVSDRRLDAYANVVAVLPSKVRGIENETDEGEDEGDGFFVATSAFRSFVTDNLAQGRTWFAGFATANTGGKRPRYIHYFRDRERGLGALYPEEKKGIVAMIEYLERAEHLLVTSVHAALRGRFAQIAREAKDAPATMRNRFKGERERLRLSFAGAKTADQIRGALADLWSRGGPNKDLQGNWRELLPLLRPDCWQLSRDLALVALASYQGASRLEEDGEDTDDQNSNGAADAVADHERRLP